MRARLPLALGAGVLAGLVTLPARAEGAAAAPGFAVEPAAALDPATFAYTAPVWAQPSPDGVSRIRLSPALLAVAQEGLADVRVVDVASRQWPFVLAADDAREPLDLALSPRAVPPTVNREPGRSRWRLVPPVAPVAIDAIAIRVDRETFDRGYRLAAEGAAPRAGGPPSVVVLAAGRLVRSAGVPAEITVKVPETRVAALVLTVDDGDEAPLPLAAARAASPVADLFLVAPEGAYTLLAGDPAARAPRYEVGQGRDRVLAARVGEGSLGALAPNPRHVAPEPKRAGESVVDRVALWGALGLAVVVLGALTLRLSRREAG